jgi:hypothetical protein
VRSLAFLIWAVAVAATLLPLWRRPATASPAPRPVVRDELVKDPVCQTYVVRSRAVVRGASASPLYFCSTECARRYAGATGR